MTEAAASEQMLATHWIIGDDTGVSSKAIWAHMMGVNPAGPWGFGHPHDPSDFGRCYRLLRRIPGWRDRIEEMKEHGKVWAALASAWTELEQLYEEQVDVTRLPHRGKASKLYDRMKELIDGAERDPIDPATERKFRGGIAAG